MEQQKQTILDLFDSLKDFESMLDDAESNVRGGWETDFVNDMQENFLKWGYRMYLSDAQYNKLKTIAER